MAIELSAVRALDDAAPPPRIPMAILEDRYEGLVTDSEGCATDLQHELWKLLHEVIVGVTRAAPRDDDEVTFRGVKWSNPGESVIVDEITTSVRRQVIDLIDEMGLAR